MSRGMWSHPSRVTPERWIRTYPTDLLGIMSCHWADVERGYVVPNSAGQIFHFVDLNEFWMYLGMPKEAWLWLGEPKDEEEPAENKWAVRIVMIVCLVLVVFELGLIWQLCLHLNERGVL